MSHSPSQASDISEFAAWELLHPSNLAEENSREPSVLMADMASAERLWKDRDSSNDARSSSSGDEGEEQGQSLPVPKATGNNTQDLGKGTDDAPPSSQPREDEDKVRRPAGMTEGEYKKARKAAKKARKQAMRKEKFMSRKGMEGGDVGEVGGFVKSILAKPKRAPQPKQLAKESAEGRRLAEGKASAKPKHTKAKKVSRLEQVAKPEQAAESNESAEPNEAIMAQSVSKPILQDSTTVYDNENAGGAEVEAEPANPSGGEGPVSTKPSRREKKAAKQATTSPHFLPKPMAVSKQVQRETQDMPKAMKKLLQQAGKAVKDAAVVVEKTVEDNAKVSKPKGKKPEKFKQEEGNSEPATADGEMNKKKRKRERNHNRLSEGEAKSKSPQIPALQSVANATPIKSQGSKDNGENKESGRKKPRGDRGRKPKGDKTTEPLAEVAEPAAAVTENTTADNVPDILEADEPAKKKRRRDRGRKPQEKQQEDVEMADQPATAETTTDVQPSESNGNEVQESQVAALIVESQLESNEADAEKPREKRPRPPRGQRKAVEEDYEKDVDAPAIESTDVEMADVKQDVVASVDSEKKASNPEKKSKGLLNDSQIIVEDSQATASQVTQDISNDAETNEPKDDLPADSQAIVEDSQATAPASQVTEAGGESKRFKKKKRKSEDKHSQSQSQETSDPSQSQVDGEPLNELADTNSKSPKGDSTGGEALLDNIPSAKDSVEYDDEFEGFGSEPEQDIVQDALSEVMGEAIPNDTVDDSDDENNAEILNPYNDDDVIDHTEIAAPRTPTPEAQATVYTPSRTSPSANEANLPPAPTNDDMPPPAPIDDNDSMSSFAGHDSPDENSENELANLEATTNMARGRTTIAVELPIYRPAEHSASPTSSTKKRTLSDLARDSHGRFAPKDPSSRESSTPKPKRARRSSVSVSAHAKKAMSQERDAHGRFARDPSGEAASSASKNNRGRSESLSTPSMNSKSIKAMSQDRDGNGRFAPKGTPSSQPAEVVMPRPRKEYRKSVLAGDLKYLLGTTTQHTTPSSNRQSESAKSHLSQQRDTKGKFGARRDSATLPPQHGTAPDLQRRSTSPPNEEMAAELERLLTRSSTSPLNDETRAELERLQQEESTVKQEPVDEGLPKAKKTKRQPTKSPFFAQPTTPKKGTNSNQPQTPSRSFDDLPSFQTQGSAKNRTPAKTVSCIPFPPLSAPHFGLIQEKLAHDPFRLLIAVTFLIRTHGKHAIPVFFELMERYPTPETLIKANVDDIVPIIRHLGLQNQRAQTYKTYAETWLENPPTKGRRYPVRGYPDPESARNVKKDEILDDEDERHAWEIGHMTSGPYAIDSWRIFCRDKLRGIADSWNGEGASEGFQPEWMRVVPEDKELRAYLRWMWLKEGFEWDPFTGDKEVANPNLIRAAIEGRIVWDDQGGMRIVDDGEIAEGVASQTVGLQSMLEE
ncbi:uncharacterized protein PAC_00939 [Phialocephala subalpina]|uniref:5-methylcytosine G/T mismatch-specific DNA glycosylase n=1 Tax=Phialocephala subalpina TaxID=576137 RepID=A0A1L7WE80_9HELO|nr:uncharacterized protein PAC_00939 [Phialocephala subalpina]